MAEAFDRLTGYLPTDAFTAENDPDRLSKLERIFAISHAIITNPSIDDILHAIVQAATELVACEAASILLSDASTNTLNFVAVSEDKDHLFNIPVPIDHSIAGAAFASSTPLIVHNVQQDPRYFPKVDELLNHLAHSQVSVPLKFRDRKIGVLQVVNKKQGQFDRADVDVLVALAAQATITIEIARLYHRAQDEIAVRTRMEAELRRHQDQLEELVKERTDEVQRLAIKDPLTGLFNRSHLMLLGDQAMEQATRYHHPFSVMLIDIDHLRKVNDTYGHTIGDEAMKNLADILRLHLRSADIIGRYGGEEFVVLMPDTDLQSAYLIAERLVSEIGRSRINTSQGQVSLTVSIGVVEKNAARVETETLASIIDRADEAMYTAKRAGRNQVFVGSEEHFIARLYRQAQEEIASRIKVEEELRRHQEHLEELVKERTAEVQRLIVTDTLTGLFIRGHLMTLGDQSMRKAYDEHSPFSAMMIDIDHFKNINETCGLAIGDEVLKNLADILRLNARPEDIVGRYSGEEFVVLMPNTDLRSAYKLADHLLDQIRASQVSTEQGPLGFTASIGLVEMDQNRRQSLDSLIDLADQAMGTAKQSGRNQVFVGNLLAEVQRMATIDPLTGLFNRGYWTLIAQQAVQEAHRYHTPVSAMMIDLDHFKNFNDTYGHAVGDAVLKKLADIFRLKLRSTDIAGRYGGDEFVILLPNTNLQAAYELANRLTIEVRASRVDTSQGQIGFSLSIGVAEINQTRRQSVDTLIHKADQAMYKAKQAGRHQGLVGKAE